MWYFNHKVVSDLYSTLNFFVQVKYNNFNWIFNCLFIYQLSLIKKVHNPQQNYYTSFCVHVCVLLFGLGQFNF